VSDFKANSSVSVDNDAELNKKKWYKNIPVDRAVLMIGIVALSIIFTIINPNFLTKGNIFSVLRQGSGLAIIAAGVTLALLLGGIDLSVGAIIGLISVFGATMVVNYGVVPGVLIALVVAAAIGAFQGSILAKYQIPAFIVTLGGQQFWRGAAYVYSNGMPVSGLPSAFRNIGSGSLLGIPIPALVAAGIYITFHFILNRTKTGRYLYAIGGNEEAAVLSGIKVFRYKVFAHCMSGLLAGIAAIVLTSRVISGQPTLGDGMELQAVAAAIIGGTSFRGGEGSMVGTLLGVVLISVLSNGLNLIRVSSFIQMMVLGAIIVIAVILDTIQRKKEGR